MGLKDYLKETVTAREQRALELQQQDRLLEDETGELGTECPYIPEAPVLPREVLANA